MTHVLFWDIDGTLLSTARGGVFALEAATREMGCADVDVHSMKTGGLTDAQIVELVLTACGREPDEEAVDQFLRIYERELPAALHRRDGRVLPQVHALLDDLSQRDDVLSLLLTGNTPGGAEVKLRHYGLEGRFDAGAFCVGTGPRDDIARAAVELARDRLGADPDPERTLVIGDTPHDITCARAIGARCLAVATGAYSREELAAHDAWRVVDELPDPVAFRELVGLD
jgi:phosphoglycolate phosphatase-like HAD superfamily hydrolase